MVFWLVNDSNDLMDRLEPSARSDVRTQLSETYAHRFAGQENQREEVWVTLNRHFFQRWVDSQGTVLDLGAGYCEFINSIHARNKLALDLNPATRQHAAEGVRVLAQDVAEPWQIPSASVDVVFTSNFLEHLAAKDVLIHCLKEAMRILRPGGRFIALGPNIRFAYSVYWDFLDHYLPLSDRSLVEALELCGFRLETVIPQFLPFTMKGRSRTPTFLIRIYLALPWAWRIFGKQFLVVASRY